MRPRSSSRERNTSASVTVTVSCSTHNMWKMSHHSQCVEVYHDVMVVYW